MIIREIRSICKPDLDGRVVLLEFINKIPSDVMHENCLTTSFWWVCGATSTIKSCFRAGNYYDKKYVINHQYSKWQSKQKYLSTGSRWLLDKAMSCDCLVKMIVLIVIYHEVGNTHLNTSCQDFHIFTASNPACSLLSPLTLARPYSHLSMWVNIAEVKLFKLNLFKLNLLYCNKY